MQLMCPQLFAEYLTFERSVVRLFPVSAVMAVV